MSRAAHDLIDGYLAELGSGLRVPSAEVDLILAEAEDHLRETAAAGLAVAAGYGAQTALRRVRQETRCTTASIRRG
jgi:hypothetical protein